MFLIHFHKILLDSASNSTLQETFVLPSSAIEFSCILSIEQFTPSLNCFEINFVIDPWIPTS